VTGVGAPARAGSAVAADAGDPLLSLERVSKMFPVRSPILRRTVGRVHAVDDASLTVGRGETVGLVGESGSGKSTLGRLALRLLRPDSGTIRFDGHDITRLADGEVRPLRRSMQMVFQDPYSSLDPKATIADSVGEPLRTHLGLRGPERDERVGELLERVHLSPDHARRHPHQFSGGQLQRIALARALAVEPTFVVCDEPVSSLDVSTRAQVLDLMGELQRDLGLAYLFISHDLSVVRNVSHRIAVMYLGRVVEIGAAARVAHDPQHPYTRALLSAVPIPDPVVQRRRERIILAGDMPDPTQPPSGCRFHTRCPIVMDVCRTEDPSWTVLPDGGVACWAVSGTPTSPGSPGPGAN
jgi:oligopeptide/dipeptide ABC transporter ATP-binding protein